MVKTRMSVAVCVASLVFGACGSDDERDIETANESLTPQATTCVTSDDCLYGHCTTEDGDCYRVAGCPTDSCNGLCFGICVATPSPRR